MSAEDVALVVFLLAAIPAGLFVWNLFLFRPPAVESGEPGARERLISILIPARNEEAGIGDAVRAALTSRGVSVEVLVMDDQSEDGTAASVEELARRDPRARLLRASSLPAGWCGKQHACWLLAEAARGELMLFVDADVRLEPEAAARLAGFLERSRASLVSGVPRQTTGTLGEKLLIPLIHFLLLGYLPFAGMRRFRHPAFGAGCGQLMMARRQDYLRAGGHRAICRSLHDGVTLPRAFRRAGLHTDLCDATRAASCRMYRSGSEVWRGLRKNAGEGIASPWLIGPFTVLLGGGQIIPFLWVWLGLAGVAPFDGRTAMWLSGAVVAAWLPRFLGVAFFRQSLLGAILHPVGIGLFLLLQWSALLGELCGKRVAWRDRVYS